MDNKCFRDKIRLTYSNISNYFNNYINNNDNDNSSSDSESDCESNDGIDYYETDEAKKIRHIERQKIYPQFKNIDINSNDNYISAIEKHYQYNNKHCNYLSFTEIDCYKYPNITISNDFNKPIIYRGFCHSMKAIKEWNIDNLPDIFGTKKFSIETYSTFEKYCNHASEVHKTENMKFFIDYIKNIINNGFIDNTTNYYAGEVSLSEFKNRNLYNYIINDKLKRPVFDTTIFAGAKYSGSQTHIHLYDDYILNQIIGTKILYFLDINDNIDKGLSITSPYDNNPKFLVYNNNFTNNSNISINEINDTIFNINYLDHSKYKIYKVVLNPGDSIVIPPWWAHNAISYEDFTLGITHKIARNNDSYLYYIPSLPQYISLESKAERRIQYMSLLKIVNKIFFLTPLSLLFVKLNWLDYDKQIKKITLTFIVFFIILIYSTILKYSLSIFNIHNHFIIFFIITSIIYFIIIDLLFHNQLPKDKPRNYDILTDTYFNI